jgi:hypothetical protein
MQNIYFSNAIQDFAKIDHKSIAQYKCEQIPKDLIPQVCFLTSGELY